MMETMLKRGAGILLPVSALPSPYGIGTFGQSAYKFVDILKRARQSYWQVLPLGPTGFGDSPYQPDSAFAGNPCYIDLDILKEEGLVTREELDGCEWSDIPEEVKYDAVRYGRLPILKKAYKRSMHKDTEAYQTFCREQEDWLSGYTLYMACKELFNGEEWLLWDEDIRLRKPEAVLRYEKELEEAIDYCKFLQFKFYGQWDKLKKYANENGIGIIGDIPIYVPLDSADVWCNTEQFQLDEKTLLPKEVSGVPPDAFSEEGQLWGNPLYDWDKMEAADFPWWRARMKVSARLYDAVRIDHFIGVAQYYSIPYGCTDAKSGRWKTGPGKKLTDAINEAAGETKIIAEDLGIFSPAVKKLLVETGYPGMRVIQFAFSGDRFNTHLPHCYEPNSVVYGGTHDNETLVGFFKSDRRQWWELQYIADYLGASHENEVVDKVFRAAYGSVSSVAIFQMQDVLKLDNWARMNTPSTVGNNWRWRMTKDQFGENEIGYLAKLVDIYGRF